MEDHLKQRQLWEGNVLYTHDIPQAFEVKPVLPNPHPYRWTSPAGMTGTRVVYLNNALEEYRRRDLATLLERWSRDGWKYEEI